jgi:hypothetical protein
MERCGLVGAGRQARRPVLSPRASHRHYLPTVRGCLEKPLGRGCRLQEEWLERLSIVTLAPRVSLGGMLTGTLNFDERRTKARLRHGYSVATRTIRQYKAMGVSELRNYNPRLPLITKFRLIFRALPPCNFVNPFTRRDTSVEEVHDFQIPAALRRAPEPCWAALLPAPPENRVCSVANRLG